MSYDIEFGVKVEGMDGYVAVIGEPEYSSPTYNLRNMFVACMDWDYTQGEWYNCAEVIPKFERGVRELHSSLTKYEKYKLPSGYASVDIALKTLESVLKKAQEIARNEIPLEHLWMRW